VGARRLALPLAAVGLIAIGVAQGVPNRHSIEDDLTRRSAAALAEAGVPGVDVSFTGRDGTLRLPPGVDGDRAVGIVRGVEGVRVVRAVGGSQPSPATPPSVSVAVDGGRAILTGTVPSEAARSGLVGAAEAVLGAGDVTDRLTVDPGVGDGGLAGLGGVIRALGPDAAGAVVQLRDGVITLTGTVPSQSTRDFAVRSAEAAIGGGANVVDHLRVAAAPPQVVAGELRRLPPITFERGSATLTAQGRASVERAAAVLASHPEVRVRIEGHTDSTGTAEANLVLSRARAQTVVDTLRSLGVAADRMTAAGFGEARPKVPDTTPANQAINRRVEFIVLT